MKNGSVNWHNPKTASFLTARNWWIVKKNQKKVFLLIHGFADALRT